jgi:hypothetical protein
MPTASAYFGSGPIADIADAYSITLSARANNDSGTVTPIALAVLRLITNSNLVGCSTGMSATVMPWKRTATSALTER